MHEGSIPDMVKVRQDIEGFKCQCVAINGGPLCDLQH